MEFNQYDILLVNFDPTIGAEIKKTRPCVIISPNEMNFNIQTLIVAPMTSKNRNYPTRIKVDRDSYIVLDQIRSIDKKRVMKNIGKIDNKTIKELKDIIKEMLVD